MSYWLKASFKALQDEWYQRLEQDGFDDAEELVNGELSLKKTADHCYYGMTDLQRRHKETYFSKLSSCVESAEFDNEIDRLILTLYAEGYSKSAITEALRQLPPRRPPHFTSDLYRSRKTVWYRICIYEMRWGLRPAQYISGYSVPGNRHRKEAG